MLIVFAHRCSVRNLPFIYIYTGLAGTTPSVLGTAGGAAGQMLQAVGRKGLARDVAVDDADSAARRLNAFFRHPDSQAVRDDARARRLIRILSWLAVAVMILLVFVAVRAILRPTAG